VKVFLAARFEVIPHRKPKYEEEWGVRESTVYAKDHILSDIFPIGENRVANETKEACPYAFSFSYCVREKSILMY
jgi:hypothetical protein